MDRPRKNRRCSNGDAFSLVEVTLAISIVGIAILPILAMLALGTDSARESEEETRAALIAETIFNELRLSSQGGIYLQVEGHPDASKARKLSGFTAANCDGRSVVLVYDEDGQVVEELGAGGYDAGFPMAPAGVSKLVRVNFTVPRSADLYEGIAPEVDRPDGLVRVDVSVEAPVTATDGNRRAHLFSSFMNLTDAR